MIVTFTLYACSSTRNELFEQTNSLNPIYDTVSTEIEEIRAQAALNIGMHTIVMVVRDRSYT